MRNKIIQTAVKRFSEYGYAKTTIEDIASDLNKVKSAVYYYFENKEAILGAAIDSTVSKLSVAVKSAVDKNKKPKDKLFALITTHLQVLDEITKPYTAALYLYFIKHDTVKKARRAFDREISVLIKSILEEGIKTKVFKIADTRLYAEIILMAIKGAEQECIIKKSLRSVKTVSEAMADIFIKSLSKE